MSRARVFVVGKVQGVGFRYGTRIMARKLGLFGFVQNLADGRVEAVFEGEKDKIEKIVAWMKKGPFLAKVSEIEIGWEEHNNEFTTFS